MMRTSENKLEAVVAKLTDVESLREAFKGCVGVFHISAFIDPSGLSGYTPWYAVGKMRAEKAAWRIANEGGLKLTTICPALITRPEFYNRNPTPTIAYPKGAQQMYSDGVLATVDLNKISRSSFLLIQGNEFENVVDGQSEAEKLAKKIKMPVDKIWDAPTTPLHKFQLSNEKLCRLMSMSLGCYTQY